MSKGLSQGHSDFEGLYLEGAALSHVLLLTMINITGNTKIYITCMRIPVAPSQLTLKGFS